MKLFNNPTLRLRAIQRLIATLTYVFPKERKVKKKEKNYATHFHIWDTGTSSSLICDEHRFFLKKVIVIGANMIVWEEDNLYSTSEGQELPLSLLRKQLPAELQGILMVMLAAKQETNKRGRKSPEKIRTIDAELPAEEEKGSKIIPFPRAA